MTWFNVNGDYKTAFAAEVDALLATDINARIDELQAHLKRLKKDLEEAEKTKATKWALLALPYEIDECERTVQCEFERKNQLVANLTEAYTRGTGERPDAKQLDRLATWLLKGAEHDNVDYDVLTDRQLARRKSREIAYNDDRDYSNIIDGNHVKGVIPGADDYEKQREYIRLPHDKADLREFNGNLRKYRVKT